MHGANPTRLSVQLSKPRVADSHARKRAHATAAGAGVAARTKQLAGAHTLAGPFYLQPSSLEGQPPAAARHLACTRLAGTKPLAAGARSSSSLPVAAASTTLRDAVGVWFVACVGRLWALAPAAQQQLARRRSLNHGRLWALAPAAQQQLARRRRLNHAQRRCRCMVRSLLGGSGHWRAPAAAAACPSLPPQRASRALERPDRPVWFEKKGSSRGPIGRATPSACAAAA
jgi:hypothetical protein